MGNPLAALKKKPEEEEEIDSPPGTEGSYYRGPLNQTPSPPPPAPTPDPKKRRGY